MSKTSLIGEPYQGVSFDPQKTALTKSKTREESNDIQPDNVDYSPEATARNGSNIKQTLTNVPAKIQQKVILFKQKDIKFN